MKDLIEILDVINTQRDRYDTLKLSQVSEQSDILRKLSWAYSHLSDHKTELGNKWLDSYHSFEGTNSARERHADNEVREFKQVRNIMDGVEHLMNAVRSTISTHKNN